MRKEVLIYRMDEYDEYLYLINGCSVEDFYQFLKLEIGEIKMYENIDEDEPLINYKLFKKGIRDIKRLGTNVIIKYNQYKDCRLLTFSDNEVFNLIKRKDTALNNILLYVSIHDFDWQSVCYFHDKRIFDNFIDFIYKNNNKVKYIENVYEFPS